jgi:hypothetical protein
VSVQLTRYLAARAAGATMMTACVQSGVAVAEARLIENDIAKGLLTLPDPVPPPKENDMARKAKAPKEEVEELHKPDFKAAIKLYKGDILPAQARVGEHAQEMSQAYKDIKKIHHVHPGAAKQAFKLDQMEPSKRDDYLRSLYGLMAELKIGISADLVDQMGDDEAPRMPVAERKPVDLSIN